MSKVIMFAVGAIAVLVGAIVLVPRLLAATKGAAPAWTPPPQSQRPQSPYYGPAWAQHGQAALDLASGFKDLFGG